MAEEKRHPWMAILIVGVLVFALAAGAIYFAIMNQSMSYGIANIEFLHKRTSPWGEIDVTVENNKSTSMEITAVFVNETEVKDWGKGIPCIFPKPQVTIPPHSRTVLRIEDCDWKSSTLEIKYVYEIRVVTSEGTVFSKSKQTPDVFRFGWLGQNFISKKEGLFAGEIAT